MVVGISRCFASKAAGPIHAAIASRSANQVVKPPRLNIQRNHLPSATNLAGNDIFLQEY
jgi:hypothetical protein